MDEPVAENGRSCGLSWSRRTAAGQKARERAAELDQELAAAKDAASVAVSEAEQRAGDLARAGRERGQRGLAQLRSESDRRLRQLETELAVATRRADAAAERTQQLEAAAAQAQEATEARSITRGNRRGRTR